MIKLCIFDLDGTVLDTVTTIAFYGNCALEMNKIEPIEIDKYKYFAGNGTKKLVENMLSYRNCYTDELSEKVFKDYNFAYNAHPTYKTSIFDGMKETLDSLKQSGIKLAIVSNKPDFAAKSVANDLYGEGYFDIIYGACEGIPLKPNPQAIYEIMEKSDIKKEETIYIGDTSTDMKAGKNAGLFTIGVLWGFRDRKELEETGADLIIEKPIELYEYIRRIS